MSVLSLSVSRCRVLIGVLLLFWGPDLGSTGVGATRLGKYICRAPPNETSSSLPATKKWKQLPPLLAPPKQI